MKETVLTKIKFWVEISATIEDWAQPSFHRGFDISLLRGVEIRAGPSHHSITQHGVNISLRRGVERDGEPSWRMGGPASQPLRRARWRGRRQRGCALRRNVRYAERDGEMGAREGGLAAAWSEMASPRGE